VPIISFFLNDIFAALEIPCFQGNLPDCCFTSNDHKASLYSSMIDIIELLHVHRFQPAPEKLYPDERYRMKVW